MSRVAARNRPALVEARKTQILDAALAVIAKKGFDAASVDEIARAAGVAKGTVYLYFSSKEALLGELVRRHSLLPDVEVMFAQLGDLPAEEVVPRVIPLLWDRLKSRKDVVRMLLREGAGKLPNAHLFLERVVMPSNLILAAWLERQIGPRRAKEIDTIVAARSAVGMLLVFFVTQEILGGKKLMPISDEAITNTVSEVFLHGILGKQTADLDRKRAQC